MSTGVSPLFWIAASCPSMPGDVAGPVSCWCCVVHDGELPGPGVVGDDVGVVWFAGGDGFEGAPGGVEVIADGLFVLGLAGDLAVGVVGAGECLCLRCRRRAG